jgi:hypothetical protein
MGNILTYFTSKNPKIKHPNRQVLSSIYIRKLIDRHYIISYNYFHTISVLSITKFLQQTYSHKITYTMVEEALHLDPPIQYRGKLNVHYLMNA